MGILLVLNISGASKDGKDLGLSSLLEMMSGEGGEEGKVEAEEEEEKEEEEGEKEEVKEEEKDEEEEEQKKEKNGGRRGRRKRRGRRSEEGGATVSRMPSAALGEDSHCSHEEEVITTDQRCSLLSAFQS